MISMNIIYLDILFLVNFICDYILLLCTARVGGAVIHRVPILLSSILGGVYGCLCSLPDLPWLGHPLLKISCSVLLCLISFSGEHHLLRCTCIFLCISLMAGGFLSAATMTYNGIQYIPMHFKSLLPAFCIVYCILSLFFRNIPQLHRRAHHTVTVSLNNQSVSFRALRDSGNELYDPITNRPVLICRPDTLYPLFSRSVTWDDDPYRQFAYLSSLEPYQSRMRLIPCCTITGSGILLAFHADSVTINGRPEPHIVAFSQVDFSPESPYQAIY